MDHVTPNADSWELADEVKHDFEEAGYTSADYPLNERIAVALTVYANKKIAELEPTAGDREAAKKITADICKAIGIANHTQTYYIVRDALSAARGNRAELEAAAREARDSRSKLAPEGGK